ncbi:helix-turn-helix transcriptional regulator [Martelella radicis]|uniref:Transcriptional regulator with XRE-family HTH domain n=1 Tax=Martelella radicis TaxID=1397476 RepID=A0A7W6KRD6_9HYPH|nr:transcriptional regulator with XRE-family HTH domain [Martelella radicis]
MAKLPSYDEYTPWKYTHQVSNVQIMDIRELFAKNLRRARKEKGLSQEELAHLAEVDRTYVGALERRRYSVSIDVLDRLATVLGVQAWQLLQPAKSAEDDNCH